jgi:hypothetical protein
MYMCEKRAGKATRRTNGKDSEPRRVVWISELTALFRPINQSDKLTHSQILMQGLMDKEKK